MDDTRATISGDFQPARVPAEYARHLLVARRYFYTFPIELLDEVVDRVGVAAFQPDLLEMERSLSRECGDHAAQIGFRDGYPIRYDLLADPLSLQAAALEGAAGEPALSWLRASTRRNALVTHDAGRGWVVDTCRGYAGWLAVNPTFGAEQKRLFARWQKPVLRHGLPAVRTVAGPERYVAAVADFCARWGLIGLGGPFLPSPARPQVPVPASQRLADQMAALGTTFFLPSLFPLPDRRQLRQMIEEAMGRHRVPPHLQKWNDLIEGDSQAKKAIERYARLFRLQHYWRVLFSRHRKALKGKLGEVRHAFATFLFPYADTSALHKKAEIVRKDLALLAKARGGASWFNQASIYDRV